MLYQGVLIILIYLRLVPNCILSTTTPPWSVFIAYPSTILSSPFLFHTSFISNFCLIAIILPSSSDSTSNSNTSGIGESRVAADEPAQKPPILKSHLVVPCIFFCLVTSLEVTFQYVVVKWQPWSRKLPFEGRMFAMSNFLLTCTRSGRALCLYQHYLEFVRAPDYCEGEVFQRTTVPFGHS